MHILRDRHSESVLAFRVKDGDVKKMLFKCPHSNVRVISSSRIRRNSNDLQIHTQRSHAIIKI